MALDIVDGANRGDEAKGRISNFLAPDYGIVARFNGGPNAGHTIVLPNFEVLNCIKYQPV